MRNLRATTLCLVLLLTNTVQALEISVADKNSANRSFEQRLNALMAEIESLRSQLGNSNSTITQLKQQIQQNVTKIGGNTQNISNNSQSITNNIQRINTNTLNTSNHNRVIQNNITRVNSLEQQVASIPSNTNTTTPSQPKPTTMYWRATGKTEKGGCARTAPYPSGNYVSISSICHSKGDKGYYEKSVKRSGTSKNRIYCGYAKVAVCQ